MLQIAFIFSLSILGLAEASDSIQQEKSVLHDIQSLNEDRILDRFLGPAVRILYRENPSQPDRPQFLVVVAEVHVKASSISEQERRLGTHFKLFGVEGVPQEKFFQYPEAKIFLKINLLLRQFIIDLTAGSLKPSFIYQLKEDHPGQVFALEEDYEPSLVARVGMLYFNALILLSSTHFLMKGIHFFWGPFDSQNPLLKSNCRKTLAGMIESSHRLLKWSTLHFYLTAIPAFLLRNHSFSWLINPGIGLVFDQQGILYARNPQMAERTVLMLDQNPDSSAALVTMGWLHVSDYIRLLKTDGFKEIPFEDLIEDENRIFRLKTETEVRNQGLLP